MNPTTRAHDSSTQVSLSDVKTEVIFLMSIGVFGRLDELRERIFLRGHDTFVAHQFVKPSLPAERQHNADEPRRFAGASIRAGNINQGRRAAGSINRRQIRQISFGDWRETELRAPTIYICGQTAAITRERT